MILMNGIWDSPPRETPKCVDDDDAYETDKAMCAGLW